MLIQEFLALSKEEREKLEELTLTPPSLLDFVFASNAEFFSALPECKNLKLLNLQNNLLGPTDLTLIATAVTQLEELQILDLSGNYIGGDENQLKILVEALMQIKTLQKLFLNNALGLCYAKEWTILKQVFNCKNLQELEVRGIYLQHGNLEAFFPGLTTCKTLQKLNMVTCYEAPLSEEQFNFLYEKVNKLEFLTTLEGLFNAHQTAKLQVILDRNKALIREMQQSVQTALQTIATPLQSLILQYISLAYALPQNKPTIKEAKESVEAENLSKLGRLLISGPYNDIQGFKALLNNVSVNTLLDNDGFTYTLLHVACSNVNVPATWITTLLQQEADPNFRTFRTSGTPARQSCIDIAVEEGREDLVKLLTTQSTVPIKPETWHNIRPSKPLTKTMQDLIQEGCKQALFPKKAPPPPPPLPVVVMRFSEEQQQRRQPPPPPPVKNAAVSKP